MQVPLSLVRIWNSIACSHTIAHSWPTTYPLDQEMNEREEGSYEPTTTYTLDNLVRDLKGTLASSKVLTPSSDEYLDSIKRWSDSVEEKAVRPFRISSNIGFEMKSADSKR